MNNLINSILKFSHKTFCIVATAKILGGSIKLYMEHAAANSLKLAKQGFVVFN